MHNIVTKNYLDSGLIEARILPGDLALALILENAQFQTISLQFVSSPSKFNFDFAMTHP